MDFVHDTLSEGRPYRILTVVDQRSRSSPVIEAGCRMSGEIVSRVLDIDFIRPGKPVENAFIESFNGRLRDKCLNVHQFASLAEVQAIIEAWRVDYNTRRPHSSLGHLTPSEFVTQCKEQPTTEEVICSGSELSQNGPTSGFFSLKATSKPREGLQRDWKRINAGIAVDWRMSHGMLSLYRETMKSAWPSLRNMRCSRVLELPKVTERRNTVCWTE
ncbi:MAG: integrase core domain-containing protein [Nitrospira sp.]|nr:integrase core domain-containing protein [Nitrospira sp.]